MGGNVKWPLNRTTSMDVFSFFFLPLSLCHMPQNVQQKLPTSNQKRSVKVETKMRI